MTFIRWKPELNVARYSPVTDLAAEFLNFRNDFDRAFERSFTLSTSVSSERIAASYSNGLLTINIPRAEHSKQREIEVAVG